MPEDQNGLIIRYTLTVVNTESGLIFQLSSNSTSLSIEALRPYMNYNFSAAARTIVGQGPFSSSISVTTPQDGKYICMYSRITIESTCRKLSVTCRVVNYTLSQVAMHIL